MSCEEVFITHVVKLKRGREFMVRGSQILKGCLSYLHIKKGYLNSILKPRLFEIMPVRKANRKRNKQSKLADFHT